MLSIFETCEEAGLAESVALEKFHVRQKFPHPLDEFWGHWGAAISQKLEAAQVIRFSFGHLRQQVQHCRNEHRVGHALALDQLTETLWGELWNRDLTRTESRCCEHRGKIGNVKNRRCMQIDTAFSVRHPTVEVVEVRQDVGVSDHDALGPSRCATRIDKSEDRFRVINGIWTGAVLNLQGLFIEHELPWQLCRSLRERRMPHQASRFCIKQNLIDFSCGEPRVYRDGSNAEPAARVDQLDVVRRIR